MRPQRRTWFRVATGLLFLLSPALICWAQTDSAVRPRITRTIDDAVRVTLRGNTHPLARPQFDRGPAPENLPLRRMLLLLQRDPAQQAVLSKLLEDQQNRFSPNYHLWLTPAEFARRFGAADSDIQMITGWLQSKGFQVDSISAGRTVIEFSGTARLVRQAFRTEIHQFVVNGAQHWANATDPQIPAALAPVVRGIASLHNFPRKPLYRSAGTFRRSRATGEVTPLFTYTPSGSPALHALGPGDFGIIYNVQPLWNNSVDGAGQTIAIVADSNINLQDARDFRNLFGLPANDPKVILNGPDPGINLSEGEAILDVEWSGAVAKGASIDLVVSEDTETTAGTDLSALYIVDNDLAGILSVSFGDCEFFLGAGGNAFYRAVWEQAAAQGISVIVASGDSGSAGCDDPSTETRASQGLAVSGTASTPFNVAVGGTDFDQLSNLATYWSSTDDPVTHASALSYIREMTWNDSCADTGVTGCLGIPPSSSILPQAAVDRARARPWMPLVTA